MKAASPNQPRNYDHCVLPVPELDVARARLTALGFTVADDARHPFGTENACVYFADGTYLEPLAIGQREDCERTARKGNVFTARDQAWRFRNGENGFSAIAFGTEDADGDHKAFVKQGISAGRKLLFGRTFRAPGQKPKRATFKLAFAADLRSPDCFFFTCQRIEMANMSVAALTQHANGVTGTAEIVMSEVNPTDFQYLLQDVTSNRDTAAQSFGMDIACANANVCVMTPEGLYNQYGAERTDTARGLRLEGLVLTVPSLDGIRDCAAKAGIAVDERPGMVVIDEAPGQGAFFAFREPAR